MAFTLAPTALSDGYRLEAHDSVGSTNALALEHARAGDPGKLWVVSRRQESGRGRRGRAWDTPSGNLAATLLIVGSHDLGLAATLGFVAGLSLADALNAVVPNRRIAIGPDGGQGADGRSRFELKWPNDVLADGAKLAGILLESAMLDDGRFALAIGIGVNVVAYPEDVPYPATSLAALGVAGRCGDAVPGAVGCLAREQPQLGRRARACADPPALAFARRRSRIGGRGARRRQCRSRRLRDHRRGLPVRHPRGRAARS